MLLSSLWNCRASPVCIQLAQAALEFFAVLEQAAAQNFVGDLFQLFGSVLLDSCLWLVRHSVSQSDCSNDGSRELLQHLARLLVSQPNALANDVLDILLLNLDGLLFLNVLERRDALTFDRLELLDHLFLITLDIIGKLGLGSSQVGDLLNALSIEDVVRIEAFDQRLLQVVDRTVIKNVSWRQFSDYKRTALL